MNILNRINLFTKVILVTIVTISININICSANNTAIIQNESPELIGTSNNHSGVVMTNSNNSGVVATNPDNSGNVGGVINTPTNDSIISEGITGSGNLKKAEDYVENKLFDIVGFFQSFVRPLSYVTFILSCIFVLFGVVTDSKSKFHGFIGMAFSVFVYVAVVFAPQVVDYFSMWLAV